MVEAVLAGMPLQLSLFFLFLFLSLSLPTYLLVYEA